MKIEYTRTFPTTRKAGFAFFMDVAGWEEWTPFHVEGAEEAQFADKGDELRVTYRRFGLPVPGKVILEEVVADELISATLRFPGLPMLHERFVLHGTGTHAFVLEASFELGNGGPLGRSLPWMTPLPLLVRRDLRRSLDKVHAVFAGEVLDRAAKKAA